MVLENSIACVQVAYSWSTAAVIVAFVLQSTLSNQLIWYQVACFVQGDWHGGSCAVITLPFVYGEN